ncbi:MAG: glycosyltransferase family 2 protein [Gemmatimonadaceae bacterium]
MPETNLNRGPTVSVVTPTLDRPAEVKALLENLARQKHLPLELVLVDGAPAAMNETCELVSSATSGLPYDVQYVRLGGGTAIQRNIGINAARGEFIAFIDDDIVLEPAFFEEIIAAYAGDTEKRVGAIAGYISNQYLNAATSPRWRWYRRLRLFSTYEPGRFDFASGYPINRYMQPPHQGVREIDFAGSNCVVWRREVFDQGLRFSEFFADYGVVEDAHLALSARSRGWKMWEAGRARCLHMHSPRGRVSARRVARKTAVNYRFLFVDIVPDRTLVQEFRFWRVQFVDLVRLFAWAARHGEKNEWAAAVGKLEGIIAATRVRPGATKPPR